MMGSPDTKYTQQVVVMPYARGWGEGDLFSIRASSNYNNDTKALKNENMFKIYISFLSLFFFFFDFSFLSGILIS